MDDTPFGANMAIQKWAFEKYGDFRDDLGPQPGGRPQKSEDSEFGHRLLAAGERLRYEPKAVVYHGVPPERLQKSYFLAWWFDKARADVIAFGVPRDTRWFAAGVPVYLLRRLVLWSIRWAVSLSPSSRFSAKTKVWSLAGTVVECYRQTSLQKHGAITQAQKG
jgi:GT2 family glycosyltransferase